jgi:Ca2+-binding RTX toxin-like protein
MLSATDNVVKAQSTGGGVTGLGTSRLTCSTSDRTITTGFPLDLSFSASTGPTGSINSGEFSIDQPLLGNFWTGSISSGTVSTTSYSLTGVIESINTFCIGDPLVPKDGDTVTISGTCGDNVPIQYLSTNENNEAEVTRGTFTGNVQCIVPPPTPIPPPASSCTGSGSGNSVITGTPGPDTIIGTSGNNVISGLEGDDLINGCGGSDRISGNADDDGIAGGPQADDLNGNEGDDIMQGDDGNDRLAGGSGINSLTGGPGRDDFICSPGSETTITDFEPGIDRLSGPCILAALAEEMSMTSIPLEVFPMPLPN